MHQRTDSSQIQMSITNLLYGGAKRLSPHPVKKQESIMSGKQPTYENHDREYI